MSIVVTISPSGLFSGIITQRSVISPMPLTAQVPLPYEVNLRLFSGIISTFFSVTISVSSSVDYGSSITTGSHQSLYLSKHDVDLIKGKRVAIIDDVVSTGESLKGLEDLVNKAGGIISEKLFVLAEADAKDRPDVTFLAHIPIFK